MTDDVDIISIISDLSSGGSKYSGPSVGEWTELSVRVAEFLENMFPPSIPKYWEPWRSQVLGLGRSAIPLLLLWMRDGHGDEQYTCLYALRVMGADAWAFGFEPDIYYEVSVGGIKVTVRPSTREMLVEPAAEDGLIKNGKEHPDHEQY